MTEEKNLDIDALRASETARLAEEIMKEGTIRKSQAPGAAKTRPEITDPVEGYARFIVDQNAHIPMTRTGSRLDEESVVEAKLFTGPGKKHPKRLIGIYSAKGKWIKDMKSEAEASQFVEKRLQEEMLAEEQTSEDRIDEGERIAKKYGGKVEFQDRGLGPAGKGSSVWSVKCGPRCKVKWVVNPQSGAQVEISDAWFALNKKDGSGEWERFAALIADLRSLMQ